MITDSSRTEFPINRLQPAEIERANRYHQPADRNRFVYGRYLLRGLLAHYMDEFPDNITFTNHQNHKPTLRNSIGWQFNVSHSGNWVMIAIAQDAVGIDVETFHPAFNFQSILPSSFTAVEQQFMQTCPDPIMAFYQLWTRKEALVKATGKGLDDDFLSIPSLEGFHRLDSRTLGATGDWSIQSFMVAQGCPAAVAYPIGLAMPKFYTIDGGFFTHFTS